MELLFDNLQTLNQEFDEKLFEFASIGLGNAESDVDKAWFLLNVKQIAGLPAFYVLTAQGVITGALGFNHELQIETPSYDELLEDEESFKDEENVPERIEEILNNGAKDEKDYQLLQQVEDAVKRSTYAWLLTNWYEPQAENGNSEQAHQMIFADLMVLDNELSSMIDFMSEHDPEETFNVVADIIANNGLDNPQED